MRHLKSCSGLTMTELVISSLLVGIVALFIATNLKWMPALFQQITTRGQINSDARTCSDTIVRLLKSARPETVVIDTPVAGPPGHHISFTSTSNKSYVISWRADPFNTVALQEGNLTPRQLAANVAGLSFTQDFRDPALITMSLLMEATLIQNGKRLYISATPVNQTIRVGTGP